MSKTKKKPRDLNRLAFAIVEEATTDELSQETDEATKKKRAASRKGGLKGGKARMSHLTPEERSELARKAASARWKK